MLWTLAEHQAYRNSLGSNTLPTVNQPRPSAGAPTMKMLHSPYLASCFSLFQCLSQFPVLYVSHLRGMFGEQRCLLLASSCVLRDPAGPST